jgi:hypothetical protein
MRHDLVGNSIEQGKCGELNCFVLRDVILTGFLVDVDKGSFLGT